MGWPLTFNFKIESGSATLLAEVEDQQSDWAEAGIHVNVIQEPADPVFASLEPCVHGDGGCGGDMFDGAGT